jgi:hypothetical protein
MPPIPPILFATGARRPPIKVRGILFPVSCKQK